MSSESYNNNFIVGNFAGNGLSSLTNAVQESLQYYGLMGDLNMNKHQIVNCAEPTTNDSVVTLRYFNTHGSGGGQTSLNLISESTPNTGNITMNDFILVNLNQGVNPKDSVNMTQLQQETDSRVLQDQQLSSQLLSLEQNLSDNYLTTQQSDNRYQSLTTPLNLIPVAQGKVDLNQQQLENTLAIRRNNLVYIECDDAPVATKIHQQLLRNYAHPAIPTEAEGFITLNDYQNLLAQTSINQILPDSQSSTVSTDQFPVIWNQAIGKLTQSTQPLTELSTTSALQQEATDRVNQCQVLQDQIDAINTDLPTNYVSQDYLSANYYNKTDVDLTVDDLQNQLNNKLNTSTTLNQIALPTSNVDMNNYQITNLQNGVANSDAINLGQLIGYLVNYYDKAAVDGFVLGLQNQIDQISTEGITLDQLNTILTNYVTNQQFLTTLGGYVSQSYLTTTLQQYVTTQLFANTLIDYVKTSDLNTRLADYYTKAEVNSLISDFVTLQYLQANYYDKSSTYTKQQVDANIITAIALLENVYVSQTALATILSSYSTTSQMNTAIASAVATETTNRQSADSVLQGQITDLQNSKNKITTNTGNASLTCSTDNRIDIRANGTNLGYFYQPVGQATTPLGLLSPDKIQLSSGMNSFSCYGQSTTPVNGTVYSGLRSQVGDNASVNCYAGIECDVSGSNNSANLTFVGGHANLLGDGVQRPFMSLSDQNNSANALSLAVRNPVLSPTDSAYTQYNNAFATGLSLPQHSFQGTAGYNTTTAITLPNQFVSKTYFDTNAVSTSTSALTNYYTKTVTDAFSLSKWTAPTGPIAMGNQKITGLGTPTLSTDACTKGYADSLITPQSQIYIHPDTIFANSTTYTITHNLGANVSGLSVQVFVKFTATTQGWGTTQWLRLGDCEKNPISAVGYTIGSSSVNSFNFVTAAGIGILNLTDQSFATPNWGDCNTRIVVTRNDGKYLVTSSQYATSNLLVNSDIDCNNSYKLLNLPDPVSSQQAVTVNYLTNQNYQTQTSADNRYYLKTVTLNNITQANGSVNLGGQKITGLGLATANTDAVSYTQLLNYQPTAIYSSDLSTNISCNNSNLITSAGNTKWVGNAGSPGSFQHVFTSNTSGISTPSLSSAVIVVDQATSSVNSRWALAVQSTTSVSSQALISYGITYVAQRAGSGQTSSSQLFQCEGQVIAPGFQQAMPSRLALKKDIVNFTPDNQILNIQPKQFRYKEDVQYVIDKGIDTTTIHTGFIYEDIEQLNNSSRYTLDDTQLNLTTIHQDILYALVEENRWLKQQVQSLAERLTALEQKLSN